MPLKPHVLYSYADHLDDQLSCAAIERTPHIEGLAMVSNSNAQVLGLVGFRVESTNMQGMLNLSTGVQS